MKEVVASLLRNVSCWVTLKFQRPKSLEVFQKTNNVCIIQYYPQIFLTLVIFFCPAQVSHTTLNVVLLQKMTPNDHSVPSSNQEEAISISNEPHKTNNDNHQSMSTINEDSNAPKLDPERNKQHRTLHHIKPWASGLIWIILAIASFVGL